MYVERVPVAAADDSIRVVGDIDRLTSLDETDNTGTRFVTAATITDLPDRIRLDYETTPTTPLTLTWQATSPIVVTDGTFDAQLKGPEARVIHGAFETGAVGAGALPPAATLRVTEDADGTGGSVLWSTPVPVTDTFPTPTVPPFDPATVTRVHAGAQLSTHAEACGAAKFASMGTSTSRNRCPSRGTPRQTENSRRSFATFAIPRLRPRAPARRWTPPRCAACRPP